MLNARPEAMAAYLKQAGKSPARGDEFVTKYPKKGSDAVERVEYGPSLNLLPASGARKQLFPRPPRERARVRVALVACTSTMSSISRA